MLYVYNATILTPEETITDGAVLADGGRIVAVGPASRVARPAETEGLDSDGSWLVPGFIDLQLNGAFGHDFTADPGTIWQVAAGLPGSGVTSFLPTIVSSPEAAIRAAQSVLAQGPSLGHQGAAVLGLHLEGPFLNPQKKGAHNPAYLRRPSPEAVAGWSRAEGVWLATLAPELPGALEVIAALAERGVVVSAGHSMASYEEARAALRAGIRYGTHLFNTMPPLGHREPGLVGALLEAPDVCLGLITDGHHVHPGLISALWPVLASRLSVVTDAMAALGMPAGRYDLADQVVIVDGQTARLEDDTLAGSIITLDAALRNLIAFTGCDLAQALPTVTARPAALLGVRKGRVAPGYAADLVLLDQNYHVVATIIGGDVIYQRTEEEARPRAGMTQHGHIQP